MKNTTLSFCIFIILLVSCKPNTSTLSSDFVDDDGINICNYVEKDGTRASLQVATISLVSEIDPATSKVNTKTISQGFTSIDYNECGWFSRKEKTVNKYDNMEVEKYSITSFYMTVEKLGLYIGSPAKAGFKGCVDKGNFYIEQNLFDIGVEIPTDIDKPVVQKYNLGSCGPEHPRAKKVISTFLAGSRFDAKYKDLKVDTSGLSRSKKEEMRIDELQDELQDVNRQIEVVNNEDEDCGLSYSNIVSIKNSCLTEIEPQKSITPYQKTTCSGSKPRDSELKEEKIEEEKRKYLKLFNELIIYLTNLQKNTIAMLSKLLPPITPPLTNAYGNYGLHVALETEVEYSKDFEEIATLFIASMTSAYEALDKDWFLVAASASATKFLSLQKSADKNCKFMDDFIESGNEIATYVNEHIDFSEYDDYGFKVTLNIPSQFGENYRNLSAEQADNIQNIINSWEDESTSNIMNQTRNTFFELLATTLNAANNFSSETYKKALVEIYIKLATSLSGTNLGDYNPIADYETSLRDLVEKSVLNDGEI